VKVRRAPFAELVRGLSGQRHRPDLNPDITGISVDSRQVRPGDLFVALPGTQTHGRFFVPDAVRRGAKACVTTREGPLPEDTPALVHPSPQLLLPEIAARFYAHPASELILRGVTGTNGKTTTALLLHHLLSASGRSVACWTTTRVETAGTAFRPKWTTPPAHELQRFLRAAADRGQAEAVLEVSSHAVQQARVGGLSFRTAIVTNISPDHLDYHGDFAHYAAAKRSFVHRLDSGAAAFLNDEDALVRTFARRTRARVFTYGFHEGVALRAVDVQLSLSATSCLVVVNARELTGGAPLRLPVTTGLTGRHNVLNVLAALGAALDAGVSPEVAQAALARFSRPPRRLELHRVGPFQVLNDVAMNEASYESVFETVHELGLPRPVVVHALRGRRGADLNARLARVLARWDRKLRFSPLIVSLSQDRLARYPVDYLVQPDELAAFLDAAKACELSVHVHESLAEAVAEGVRRVEPGGLLLLLGTFGMDDGPGLAQSLLEARLGLPSSGTLSDPRQEEPDI
jgi:UDP-N-acetylmuramoyl-L-alanyl-D-glutamate--2,6-diaminopimelate ligase